MNPPWKVRFIRFSGSSGWFWVPRSMSHYYAAAHNKFASAAWNNRARVQFGAKVCAAEQQPHSHRHKFNARQTIWRLRGGVTRQGKKSHQREEILNAILFATLCTRAWAWVSPKQSVWRTAGWIMEMHHIILQLLPPAPCSIWSSLPRPRPRLQDVWERACNYATYCLAGCLSFFRWMFALGTALGKKISLKIKDMYSVSDNYF